MKLHVCRLRRGFYSQVVVNASEILVATFFRFVYIQQFLPIYTQPIIFIPNNTFSFQDVKSQLKDQKQTIFG
jgi:hypothetical protein